MCFFEIKKTSILINDVSSNVWLPNHINKSKTVDCGHLQEQFGHLQEDFGHINVYILPLNVHL